MRHLLLALAVVAAGLMPAGLPRAMGGATPSGPAVWAVGDSDKIRRDDARSPLQPRNGVWDGHGIHIFGARNEVVAFQIILFGGATGARRVDVALTPLRNGRASIGNLHAPRPADPNDYRGKHVELFREHYYDLGPAPVSTFPQPGSPPLSGFVPDALIPFSARGGAPFDVAPRQNQGVWVDVTISRDAAAGLYHGQVTITAGSRRLRSLRLTLRVYPFALPDRPSLKTMLFFSRENVRERHGLAADSAAELAVDAQYYTMARRHRISLVGDYSFGEMSAIKPFLTGSYYTAAHGYAGPGAGVGSDVFPIAVYNSNRNVFGATPAAWCRRAGEWVRWFRANSPATEEFLYLWDEPAPNSDVWPWVSQRTTWLAHCTGPGRALKTFITSEPLPTLLAKGAYVSIWAATPSEIQPDDAHYVRQHGWELWLYNGEHPYSGSWLSDDYGVGPRTLPWIAFTYGIDAWFFWESTYWYNVQGGEKEIDVYQQASNFSDNRGERANGDGLLFYPGQDRVFPREDHGVRGPIPSIRLNSFRRGLQDYEYLVLAQRLVLGRLGRQVRAIVDRVIPAVLWDVQGLDSPSWSIHGDDWDAARLRLATLICSRLKDCR